VPPPDKLQQSTSDMVAHALAKAKLRAPSALPMPPAPPVNPIPLTPKVAAVVASTDSDASDVPAGQADQDFTNVLCAVLICACI
jgi:hypothetical protein